MDIKWIFFDVGGVLTEESGFTNWIQENCTRIIKKYIPDITLQKVREARPIASTMTGNLNENMLKVFLKGKQLEEALMDYKDFRAKGETHVEQQIIKPDALEVIKTLSQKYNLGMMANQHKEIKEKLEQSGILQYFKLKDVSEDFGLSKPDPKYFQTVMELAGAKPENSVIIEDNLERSIIPAKKLGMTTVWFKLEDRTAPSGVADYTITSLKELLGIF